MTARSAILVSLVLMGLGIGSAAGAVGAAPTLEMSADGEIQIATDGSVSDYRLHSQLPAAVADLIDKNVRGWSFQPVIVEGIAVVAKTAMHLGLKAESDSVGGKDNYRLRIIEIRFGEPQRNAKIRPPHYPEEAIHAHLGAKVLLAVRLDENGQVLDAQALQTSLDARPRSEGDAERWRRMFEHASVAAAKDWRYDMTETVNGKPIGANAIVPVVFSLHEVGAPPPPAGKWKVYLPGPVHPAPWMNTNPVADAGSLSNSRDDEAISLDSRFHLKDDVVGKAL